MPADSPIPRRSCPRCGELVGWLRRLGSDQQIPVNLRPEPRVVQVNAKGQRDPEGILCVMTKAFVPHYVTCNGKPGEQA